MSTGDRKRAWLVALVVFAALAPGAFFGLPGKSIAGAWRVLDGDVPYRDFWSMYAPGQFYAVAALLALSGKQVIVPALASVAVRAFTAGTLFVLARKLGSSARAATLVAFVLGLSTFELSPELSSYPPAFALVAWALVRVVDYLHGRGTPQLVRAGAALGIAAVFKHDVAGYAAIAFAVGIVAAWYAVERRPSEWVGGWRACAHLLAPAAAIVALAAAWLAFAAGRAALDDLVLFPLGDFPLVRAEPYPGLVPELAGLRDWLANPSHLASARDAAEALREWLLAHAPEVAFVLGVTFVVRRRAALAPERLGAVLVLLAMLPPYWWAAHTQQNTHLTSMAVASFLLGLSMWSEHAFRAALACGAVVYACGLALSPLSQLYVPFGVWSEPVALDLPATRGMFVSPREREVYRAVNDFVQTNVPPSEPVHCGVARHDAIVINNPRFHYLVDRPPATRYHELHPGITDRSDVQREMIADLERRRVRCAVQWRFGWAPELLDKILERRVQAIPECGAKLLDDYFATQFEPVFEVGEYVVLWRRGEPRVEVK